MKQSLENIRALIFSKSAKRHSDQQCEELIAKYKGDENADERARVLLRSDPLGNNIEAAKALADLGDVCCFAEGSTIIHKDGVDSDVYFLLQGMAIVERGESGPIPRIAPITVGELAALTPGKSRSATVWVKTGQVVALKITAREFVSFLKNFPDVEKRLNADIKSRFYELLDHVFMLEAKIQRRENPLFWVFGGLGISCSAALSFIALETYGGTPMSMSLLIAAIVAVIVGFILLRYDPRYRYQRLLSLLMGSWLFVSALPILSGRLVGTNFDFLAEFPPLGLADNFVFCVFAVGLFYLISKRGV